MAINVPMPGMPGEGFLQGIDTGSNLWSKIVQPQIQREQMQQQQNQFVQNLALQKQAQDRAQQLLPFMIQQYKDTHQTTLDANKLKEMYLNLLTGATDDSGAATTPSTPGMTTVAPPTPQQMGAPVSGGVIAPAPTSNAAPNANMTATAPDNSGGEYELRPGNARLAGLDRVAGIMPGVPKPTQHFTNGMLFTTYPSGRVTAQKVAGMQSPGQMTVNAKEASKIRDSATALINSANLVQQGYDLLDNNDDLTGIGSGLASKFNLSKNPDLGNFNSITGYLQGQLGKYVSSRGGIQAVNWAANVKPSAFKPEDYNYGMFDGINRNIKNDYNTLNAQYKSVTGEDLPVPLPEMGSKRPKPGSKSADNSSGGQKVTKKWKFVNGELV